MQPLHLFVEVVLLGGEKMDKAKQAYLDFKRQADFLELDFPLYLGDGPGFGELCMDYNEQDG